MSPTLAASVREPVTVRFEPRDHSRIRVLHRDRSLCRAVSEEHAGSTVTLKDVEAARRAQIGRILRLNELTAIMARTRPS